MLFYLLSLFLVVGLHRVKFLLTDVATFQQEEKNSESSRKACHVILVFHFAILLQAHSKSAVYNLGEGKKVNVVVWLFWNQGGAFLYVLLVSLSKCRASSNRRAPSVT